VDESQPIYRQLAERIEGEIVEGVLAEGAQIPSTNELAAFYRINPATAGKAIGQLLSAGLVEKRRGIGMFVAPGAAGQLRRSRRSAFRDAYLRPMLAEAHRLGIGSAELLDLVHRELTATTEDPPATTHQGV